VHLDSTFQGCSGSQEIIILFFVNNFKLKVIKILVRIFGLPTLQLKPNINHKHLKAETYFQLQLMKIKNKIYNFAKLCKHQQTHTSH